MINQDKLILIVDDESIITGPLQRLFRRRLKQKPYKLITSNDPKEALDDLDDQKGQGIDLAVVISDIMMPQMDGLDFLAAVRKLYPEAARIVLTGYADKANAVKALNKLDLFHYIEKPWDDDEITQLILMAMDKHRRDKMEIMFRRYVPIEVIEEYVDRSDDTILQGQALEATILFLDIVDFTQRTEKMSAMETMNLLNNYFTTLVDVIHNKNGILDKYIGDGLMALFGAPKPTGQNPADDAQNAIKAAVDIVKRVLELNEESRKIGLEPVRIRIGLNTGKVVVGNIGSDKRCNYTAVGDAVNTASRIENIARDFIGDGLACILVGQSTYQLIKKNSQSKQNDFEFEALGPVLLKGKEETVDLHKVII